MQPNRGIGFLLLTLALMMPLQGLAQVGRGTDGRLSPGDAIEISVPGRPDLTMSLPIDDEGQVLIPQVGNVGLGGLTVSEAELVLRQKMRLFDPSLDMVQIELQSKEDLGMRFYLIGQVGRPGQYTFDDTPSVWELFREAGGALENANLRQVRLVRENEGGTEVTQYDFSEMLEGGEIPAINLQPGDTLVVPALLEGVSAVPTADGVKVFGAVNVPTVVDINQPTPLLDILMLAGSPTPDSEIKKIQWVHLVGDVPQARVVDLRQYLEMGNPLGNPLVYPGDTVRVEYYDPPWYRDGLPLVLGTIASVATIWLAYDRIQRDN